MPENKEKNLKDINKEDFNFSFTNYSTYFAPGKKGGTCELPMGGKLIIPEGVLNKKDHVTCGVVTPINRFIYAPKLSNEERLHSEIFKLDTSYNYVKTPIFLQIPYQEIDNRIYEINILGQWSNEEEWVNIGFLVKKEGDETCAELTLHRGGVFVITYIPKKEKFELTANGSLYSSRLCRFCTLRCPRKAVDNTVYCSLEVIPIPAEKLVYCQEAYPFKCADLLDCVEMVDVSSSQTEDFRRPITIKMPVPNESSQPNENETEDLKTCEVTVVMKESSESEWVLLDSTRISRRMVSFDVKKLGRFCVVKAKHGRFRRMKEAVAILEDKNDKVAGCISLFMLIEEKLWTAAIACYPRKEAEYFEEEWEKRNFEKVNPLAKKDPEKTTYFDIPGKKFEYYKYNDPEFFDGLTWTINVEGNLKLLTTSDNESRLLFHSSFKEHFFMFVLEPMSDIARQLTAHVTVTPDVVSDEEERSKLTGLFTVDISPEQVDNYLYVELPEVEEEIIKRPLRKRAVSFPAGTPIITDKDTTKSKKEQVLSKSRKFSITGESMDRLTRSVRKAKIIAREARVLSGRSLMSLSRVVSNGLNLAIHLGLSESCVTGLGFDALANGLNMNDITYKILLYWKRHLPEKNENAVTQLALSFQQMGQPQIANVIMNRHSEDLEITKDCFAFLE